MLMTTCLQPNGCAVTRNRTVGWCMASRIPLHFCRFKSTFQVFGCGYDESGWSKQVLPSPPAVAQNKRCRPLRIGVRVALAVAFVICALPAVLGQQVARTGADQQTAHRDRNDVMPVILKANSWSSALGSLLRVATPFCLHFMAEGLPASPNPGSVSPSAAGQRGIYFEIGESLVANGEGFFQPYESFILFPQPGIDQCGFVSSDACVLHVLLQFGDHLARFRLSSHASVRVPHMAQGMGLIARF